MRRTALFLLIACLILAASAALPLVLKMEYFYFAAYIVLQYVILATAWNILGGYTGYVNFGTPAFFALGAYTSAVLALKLKVGILPAIGMGGLVAGVLGLGIGYLTLRLRGVFFSIATLALSVVVQIVIVNTKALGGAKGMYVLQPPPPRPFGTYLEFVFVVMVALALVAVFTARYIETSWFGGGLTAIRDAEEAAECMGVPVLKLKLVATTVSGILMGMAGAPYPYYITYLEPYSTMSLDVAVNSLAMPMIGGTTSWIGPIIGAVLLSTAQQLVTVTISSDFNLVIVGVLLVGFVVVAPDGILGLLRRKGPRGAPR